MKDKRSKKSDSTAKRLALGKLEILIGDIEPCELKLYDRFMECLWEADATLAKLLAHRVNKAGALALENPADPLHLLNKALIGTGDARSAMNAFFDASAE